MLSSLKRLLLTLSIVSLVAASATKPSFAQVTPEESLKSLQPADGVRVELWASEPMVNNPTAIDIDSRGRVWIAEGLNYRMKLKQFENMGRIEGADRIKILEDTNHDGKADKVTVFADNIFPVPLGLAVEEVWQNGRLAITRVYVGNSPDLLVFEDTDGDNVADKRYALLTGFRGVDSDHGLHGMSFGPDGKLYFTVGDARYGADNVQGKAATFDVTDKSGRRVSANNYGTTLRMNRDGSELEVLSSGHRNNYEAAVDSFGNVFGSDNDDDGNRGCRMYWVFDGGRYGYQTPESNRHWAEELPGMIPKLVGTGNGSPAGIFVYEGRSLPEQYFGSVMQIDAGTHQINVHPVARHGSAFRSDYNILLKGSDDWFRPIDLAAAPDGSLFVCDWYDAGVGGNRFSDQTTGRIYRLSGSTKSDPIDAAQIVDAPLKALMSPNKTVQLAALDVLISQSSEHRDALKRIFETGQDIERARALHVLSKLPKTGEQDTLAALSDRDARIREMAIQLLVRDVSSEFLVSSSTQDSTQPPATKHLDSVIALANDEDAGVRRTLLLGLRRVPTQQVQDVLTQLAMNWDGQDRYYLEAIRSAIGHREPGFITSLFAKLAQEAMSTVSNAAISSPPFYPTSSNDAYLSIGDELAPADSVSKLLGVAWVLQRKECLPAIRSVLAKQESPFVELAAASSLSAIADIDAGKLLLERIQANHLDVAAKRELLSKFAAGLGTQWAELRKDDQLKKAIESLWNTSELRLDVIRLIAKADLRDFAPQLRTLASSTDASLTERAAALSAIGQIRDVAAGDLASSIVELADGQPSGGELALAAMDTLKAIGKSDKLLKCLSDESMPSDLRRRALQLVASNYAGAEQALKLRASQPFSADLESELRFLLHNHSDNRVRQLAKQQVPLDPSNTNSKIHDYSTLMVLNGDAQRGREIFEKNEAALCARCHKVDGSGTLVGPDLSTIGTKYGAREMLYHIQNPSGAINYNFAAQTFLLSDGRILSGLVLKRDSEVIRLGLATGQQIELKADEIEEEKTMSASIMPEGLLATLSSQQAADLLEYLVTLRQADAVVKKSP